VRSRRHGALLCGTPTSPLGAMRYVALLALLMSVAACTTQSSPAQVRAEFWRHRLAEELHVGMPKDDIQRWGRDNQMNFTYSPGIKHYPHYLSATAETIPEKFSVLTGCRGWHVTIYVYLDESYRLVSDEVRTYGICL